MIEKKVLNVPTGNSEIVKKAIDETNNNCKTKFEFLFAEDRAGVEFAIVDTNNASIDDIFLFGFFYGGRVQGLRLKKEIDW